MNDPRPFFPFYPDDFWGSEAVETMTMEAAGLYIAMISRSWRRGSIPADPAALKVLFGGKCRAWDESLAMVMPCFYEEEGRLYNQRLEQERDIADRLSVKASGAAKVRWQRFKDDREAKRSDARSMRSHSERIADALPEQCDRNANAMQVQYSTGTGQDQQTNGAVEPPPKPKRSRPDKPTDPNHATFVEWWCESFQLATGKSYAFQGGKDAKHVADVLRFAGGDIETAKDYAARLIRGGLPWFTTTPDLGALAQHWNKLTPNVNAKPRGRRIEDLHPL